MRTPRTVVPADIRPTARHPDPSLRTGLATERITGQLDILVRQECPVRVPTVVTAESLTAELKLIRRGLGVHHPELARRLGPGLREVCGIIGDGPGLRTTVITRLRDGADTLPAELGLALLVSLNAAPEVRGLAKLEERVDWLAARLNRDVRTARRRMDEAARMLAEHLAAGRRARRETLPSTGWHIATAQSALLLETDVPTSIERRVVVAEHDGLDQLVLARSVPPAAGGDRPDIHPQMLFGGVLGLKEWDTGSRFRLVLDLPVTLRAGDRHEYAILWRTPPDRPMRPYYVFTPVLRVDHFDLHVRFGADRPDRVFQVADAFHRDLDEPPRDRDEIRPDRAGEIHLEFRDLAPGHGYGARWD
jgi:hypothetical protein